MVDLIFYLIYYYYYLFIE